MCPNESQIHAYHDGELSDAQRAAFDAHVQVCAECRALLTELEGLSRMFGQVEFAPPTARATSRMYGAFHAAADAARSARERGARHLAGWLTAAAAAVLVLVSVQSRQTRNDAVETDELASAGSGWVEAVAVMPPLEPRHGSNSEMVQFAQWIASDLSFDEVAPQ